MTNRRASSSRCSTPSRAPSGPTRHCPPRLLRPILLAPYRPRLPRSPFRLRRRRLPRSPSARTLLRAPQPGIPLRPSHIAVAPSSGRHSDRNRAHLRLSRALCGRAMQRRNPSSCERIAGQQAQERFLHCADARAASGAARPRNRAPAPVGMTCPRQRLSRAAAPATPLCLRLPPSRDVRALSLRPSHFAVAPPFGRHSDGRPRHASPPARIPRRMSRPRLCLARKFCNPLALLRVERSRMRRPLPPLFERSSREVGG